MVKFIQHNDIGECFSIPIQFIQNEPSEPPGKPSEAGRGARKSSPPGFTGRQALPTIDFGIFKSPGPLDNTIPVV